MDELTREFVNETREMLEAAGASLIAWEARPGERALIDEVFRFVHTVKGSCGFVDQRRIGDLAHAAEDVLAAAREGHREITGPLVGAMLAVIDRIALLVDALESGEPVPDVADDARLVAALTKPEIFAPREAAPQLAASTIRIPVSLLETIMGQVSDLVLARNDLARKLRTVGEGDWSPALAGLTHVVGELRDSIGRARLQPIERLFRGLPRLVRDTAAACGKDVALTIEGDDVEIDREMVEALKDPLTHIVRNAIDHGVEAAEDRRDHAKAQRASLRVSARQSGNQVTIAIEDDGRGIDTQRLIDKAVAAGIVAPGQTLTPDAATQLIFEPGLSTAREVTAISGRGVGMDVVRSNIERIGGSVVLDNRPGEGLTVLVRVPLTLSIITCLIVDAGEQRFAIPRAAISEVVSTRNDVVRYEAVGDCHIASVRGALLPVAPLGRLLALEERPVERLVIVEAAGLRFALPVNAALEHEELVVRPLAPGIGGGCFAGQSLSDDGLPLLLLDVLGLASAAGIDRSSSKPAADTVVRAPLVATRASVVTFVGLDKVVRAVRSSRVTRITDVPATNFVQTGKESFVTIDDALMPAQLDGPLPTGMVTTLRLSGEGGELAWPVERVSDLVPLGAITPVGKRGYEGLILIDGLPVPLLAPEGAAHALEQRIAA